jgi:hypothetical protein
MKNKCLIAVSMGESFNRQTEGMIKSFLAYNPDWDVRRYYDDDLTNLLPKECKLWTPFNQCEIGRWYAMQDALRVYDTVLYVDGDMRFFSAYPVSNHNMCLFPHYVTRLSKRLAKHWTWLDGVANIGIMEMSKSEDNELIFEFIQGEVLKCPVKYKHGEQLWLQNIVSHIPEIGCDCVYSTNAGLNVACWNLRKGDREVFKRENKFVVRTNEGKEFDLISFHFSSKSLKSLDLYGEAVKELKDGYISGQF